MFQDLQSDSSKKLIGLQDMKKILLIGHGGFYNRGCEAIVRGTVKIIRGYLPDCRITLTSRDPEVDEKICRQTGLEIEKVIASHKGAKKPSIGWALQTLNRRVLHGSMTFHDFLLREYYKKNDIVLSIGGDNFSDDYGGPARFFSSLDVARKCGAKTVIWGASVGPFHEPTEERRWASELRQCDLITAREQKTVEYLAGIGVESGVKRTADPAFCMEAKHPSVKLRSDFLDAKLIVGIGMSALISRYGISRKDYISRFSEFVEHLVREHKARILFIPHVTGNRYAGNDTEACEEVIRNIGRAFEYWLLPQDYNACEMKYCISKCHYFIGARTHSTIASLSTGVPTISVGYSVKAWGINQDLLDTDEYVISHRDLSKDNLIDIFSHLVRNKDLVRSKLSETVPLAQGNARKAGEYLVALC